MRIIKIGKDGIVPIVLTNKVYAMDVYFDDYGILSEPLSSKEPVNYIMIFNGNWEFIRNNNGMSDGGLYSSSIQECISKALKGCRYWKAIVYEFENLEELEKEKGIATSIKKKYLHM